MKTFIISIFICVNIVFCLPILPSDNFVLETSVLSNTNELPSDNGYKFSYDLSDGSGREEQLIIKNKGTDQEEHIVMGYYYYDDFDKIYRVDYIADKNGYRANLTIEVKQAPAAGAGFNPSLLKTLVG